MQKQLQSTSLLRQLLYDKQHALFSTSLKHIEKNPCTLMVALLNEVVRKVFWLQRTCMREKD
jgi:hypothetical protein